MECLSKNSAVILNPRIIWEDEEDGIIKRKVIIDLEKYISAPVLVYMPVSAKDSPMPAIICNHGHGQFGKDSVMGVCNSDEPSRKQEIDEYNYDYGLQMAKQGYVTAAIDCRGFGEREDVVDPYGRDKCNLNFIRGCLLGVNLLTLNVFDVRRALDYLCSLECVDKQNIGTMGLSLGGTISLWLSLLDERIKATEIVCYSCCFKNYAIADGFFCGSQFVPGLFQLCDVPDLHGLIAPKPVLVFIGIQTFNGVVCIRVGNEVRFRAPLLYHFDSHNNT